MAKRNEAAEAAQTAKRVMMMNPSTKGGIAKTMSSMLITDYFRTREDELAVYDANESVEGLHVTYGQKDADGELLEDQNPRVGVYQYNIRRPEQRKVLLDFCAFPYRRAITDLPGDCFRDLAGVADNGEEMTFLCAYFEKYGVDMVLFALINHLKETAVALTDIMNKFQGATVIPIINLQYASTILPDGSPLEADYPFYFGHHNRKGEIIGGNSRRACLEKNGGIEMYMPSIPSGAFSKFRASGKTLAEATRLDNMDMSIADIAHIERCRQGWAKEMRKLSGILGFKAEEPAGEPAKPLSRVKLSKLGC